MVLEVESNYIWVEKAIHKLPKISRTYLIICLTLTLARKLCFQFYYLE